jgi:hypothetical protein
VAKFRYLGQWWQIKTAMMRKLSAD